MLSYERDATVEYPTALTMMLWWVLLLSIIVAVITQDNHLNMFPPWHDMMWGRLVVVQQQRLFNILSLIAVIFNVLYHLIKNGANFRQKISEEIA